MGRFIKKSGGGQGDLTREDLLVFQDRGDILPGALTYDAGQGHHYVDVTLDPIQPDLDFTLKASAVMTDKDQPVLPVHIVEPITNSSFRVVVATSSLAGLDRVQWVLDRDPDTLPSGASAALPARDTYYFTTLAERNTWMLTNTPASNSVSVVGTAPNRFAGFWNGSTWIDTAGGEATVHVVNDIAERDALVPLGLGIGSFVSVGENSPLSDGSGVAEGYVWDGTVFVPIPGANIAYESSAFVTIPSTSWSAPSGGERTLVISEAVHAIQSPGHVQVWEDLGGGSLRAVQMNVTRNAVNSIILSIDDSVTPPDVKVAVFEISSAPSGATGTFNATTDWTLAGYDYELLIPAATHGITGVSSVQVWDGTTTRSLVNARVSVDAADNVTISVSANPDNRIAGTYTIY